MEKIGQDKIKSKINEIEVAITDGDHALDEKINTVKLNLESVKNGVIQKIDQVNVSFKMIDCISEYWNVFSSLKYHSSIQKIEPF